MFQFYAPWCGHCKNLEPIWNQVAQSLVDTDIRVARLDCTRFTSIANDFNVAGFPTILYVKGHKIVEYRGDRTREEIVDFVRRIDGPSVRYLGRCQDVPSLPHKVYFVLFECEDTDDLKELYQAIAQEYHALLYFYTSPCACNPRPEHDLLVFKDKTSYPFVANETQSLNNSLAHWVNTERFPAFTKITYGNYGQIIRTGKKIVMAILEESVIGTYTMKMKEFKDVLEAIAITTRDKYHKDFVFGYLGTPALANSVAMTVLPVPSLMVVDSHTYQYHLPEVEDGHRGPPTPQAVLELLDRILDQTAPAYGGNTYFYRLYSNYFEIKTSLLTMWQGNPLLTIVLLGMPVGVLSIIIYTSCCAGLMEADDDEEYETATNGDGLGLAKAVLKTFYFLEDFLYFLNV
ncbi:TMX3 [Cordylochernes scorpioides]|uniref:TMX3 n=1 Tax=Cordylochernes scorpioides TaxID=51811 RepID=A0ABY6LQX6_9ARAC|nr:TMX3 [Cordylochernes scorpioides]